MRKEGWSYSVGLWERCLAGDRVVAADRTTKERCHDDKQARYAIGIQSVPNWSVVIG